MRDNFDNFELIRPCSEATMAAHLKTGRRLWAAYGVSDPVPTHQGFALWILNRKPTLRGSTWRSYRRAAETHIAAMGGDQADHAMLRADALAPKTSTMHKTGCVRRTSALKTKRLPAQDFDKLKTFLRVFSKSDLAGLALIWLEAGILTGARPIEWRNAVLNGDKLTLVTAKFASWRGNGPTRTLDISTLDISQTLVITNMVESGQIMHSHGTYEIMQKKVAAVLNGACRRIWPSGSKRYSLYSARHQGAANAKASRTASEVAAILGHVSTRTAQRAYGRRSSAWNPENRPASPVPSKHEVETVRISGAPKFFLCRKSISSDVGLTLPDQVTTSGSQKEALG